MIDKEDSTQPSKFYTFKKSLLRILISIDIELIPTGIHYIFEFSKCLAIDKADSTQPSKLECTKASPPAMNNGDLLSTKHPAAPLTGVDTCEYRHFWNFTLEGFGSSGKSS